VSELLWFIEGSGNERRLASLHYGKPQVELEGKTTIWTANAEAEYWKPKARGVGDLGRVYGVQWRKWQKPKFHLDVQRVNSTNNVISGHWEVEEVDQLSQLIEGIKNDPYGRRHILTAWNPGELDGMALPPCHCFAQFYVADGKLSCQMYQRSCDMFLGVPFNIASYSLFTHMIAQVCDLGVGEFIHVLGDAHIYKNHFDAVEQQLQRIPDALPQLWMNSDVKTIDGFKMDDFKLVGYNPQSTIKAEMAV
jgi:thymidylate synthase